MNAKHHTELCARKTNKEQMHYAVTKRSLKPKELN